MKVFFLKNVTIHIGNVIYSDEQVQVKDTVDHFAGNVPVTVTAKSFSEQMDETQLITEGSESGRRKTSMNDGTALFVVNIPSDSKTLEFQVS